MHAGAAACAADATMARLETASAAGDGAVEIAMFFDAIAFGALTADRHRRLSP